MKLNGKIRFQITKEWMRRGLNGSLEDFIKKVCEIKRIEYIPKRKLNK